MPIANFDIQELTDSEVLSSRKKFGSNVLESKNKNHFIEAIKSLAKEPMVILLLVAVTVYFFIGNKDDGIFLAAAILLIAAISLYQDAKTEKF